MMRRQWWVVALSAVVGTVTYSLRATQPAKRGEYVVVEADFHVHPMSSDGVLSPAGLVLLARHNGVHAITLASHNSVWMSRLGALLCRVAGGPLVFPGEEITAPGFHMIGVELKERVDWNQSAAAAIADVHRQGGIAIAAHPIAQYWASYDSAAMETLDGSERVHPSAFSNAEWARGFREFYERGAARGRPFAAIASSDHHWLGMIGRVRTYVLAREFTRRGVLDAVRDGRTVVYDIDGTPVGSAAHVALVDSVRSTHPDERLAGAGPLSGVIGWLALMALVAFRRGPATEVRS